MSDDPNQSVERKQDGMEETRQPSTMTAASDNLEAAQAMDSSQEQHTNTQTTSAEGETISKPQSGTMEVHHHSHTERKQWKHYAFEFFMLFLAVFCGFLAEYQLELVFEHHREEQYMQSFSEDVGKDTAMIKAQIHAGNNNLKGMDSLLQLIYSGNYQNNMKQLYYLHLKHLRFVRPSFTDRTTIQLKNAGGMRLIRKQKVATAISAYWSAVDDIYVIADNYNEVRAHAKDFSHQLFHSKYFSEATTMLNPIVVGTPELMTHDPRVFAEYGNRIRHLRDISHDYFIPRMEILHKRAAALIALIKKDYNLD